MTTTTRTLPINTDVEQKLKELVQLLLDEVDALTTSDYQEDYELLFNKTKQDRKTTLLAQLRIRI